MTYTVLARRYRSRDFDEIVGQEPIARTLQNAIETGRTAHAYLFTGTRGVGKTSMARIFAKALNLDPALAQSEEIGDAILRGDDLDVIEIDGASNRGIQEAKDLIAGSGLSPTRCRFKIYIIDEVHMLTREAFNALLKTMEEPPEHVKFILCTTEAHKVPATIQSRCQRFDFRPLATPRIADQLRHILQAEAIEADDDVVLQVARLGHGSMRDALSLLDRLLAAGEPRLTSALLQQMLGMPDATAVAGLVDAIAEGRPDAALQASHELLASGTSVSQALELLTDAFRNLMVIATCGPESDLLELSSDALETAQKQAARFDAPALVHMIAVCDAVARNARGASTARALFDAAIVRLCLTEQLADIATLLAGGAPAAAAAPAPARTPAPPAPAKKKDPEPPVARPAPAPARAPAPSPQTPASEPAPAPTPPAAAASGDALWAEVETFARRSESDHARIEHLRYKSFEGGKLQLAVDEEGARMARFLAAQAPRIADLVKRATGRTVKIAIDTSTVAQTTAVAGPPREVVNDQVKTLPVVAEVMDVFDGTVIDVQEARKDV